MSYSSAIDYVTWAMQLADKTKTSEERVEIWKKFIDKLEGDDCDITCNALGVDPDYDKAYNELHEDSDDEY